MVCLYYRMSYLYRCNQQYIGNTEDFPSSSFLISGVSYYPSVVSKVTYQSHLTVFAEPENPYDPKAMKIVHNGELIGYVPKGYQSNVSDGQSLKVYHIKGGGIRVMPR